MSIPADLLYTDDHEWVKIEGGIATVGITDFAQGQLGDIVYLDVSTVGESLEQGAIFGSIEAVKTVSDLFIPVSGEVISFNDQLDEQPELVNSDPYGAGWLIKVKVASDVKTSHLLDSAKYEAHVAKAQS